jgi:hypothetical protein
VLHLGPDEVVAGVGHRTVGGGIFSFTGFQIFVPGGGANAVPYFQVAGSKGPVLTALGGASVIARLSVPLGAASGNAAGASKSSVAWFCGFGLGFGFCVCVWAAATAIAKAMTTRVPPRCLRIIVILLLEGGC